MSFLRRPSRFASLLVTLGFCAMLMFLALAGLLQPVEGVASIPLNALSGAFTRFALSISSTIEDLNELGRQQERIAELEEQLARRQIELIQLREAASDYDRLLDLLSYTRALEEQEFITADVIGVDQTGIARNIFINRGARDGVAIGMPVTTDLGLVRARRRRKRQRGSGAAHHRRKQLCQHALANDTRRRQHRRAKPRACCA